jgi:hypothetical protein
MSDLPIIPKPIITYGGRKCINLICHDDGSIEVVYRNGRRKMVLAVKDCLIEFKGGRTIYHPPEPLEELVIQIPRSPVVGQFVLGRVD